MPGRTTSTTPKKISKHPGGTKTRDTGDDGAESGVETSSEDIKDTDQPYRAGAVMRKRKTNRHYDWELIKRQYIEGIDDDGNDKERHFPTIRELGELHDVVHSRIGERASAERWNDHRAVYQNRLANERRAARVQKLGGESIEFSEQSLNTAKLGLRLVMGRLAEIGKDFSTHTRNREEMERQIANNEIIGDLRDLRSPVYYKEMDALASAAQRFQDIGLKALGEDIQRHEVSGPGGMAIESTIDIRAEMERDDPERLAKLMEAMMEANILDVLGVETPGGDDDQIIEGEVVDDENSIPEIEGDTSE